MYGVKLVCIHKCLSFARSQKTAHGGKVMYRQVENSARELGHYGF